MSQVIKGTRDRKKYQVVKGQTDARQVRCTKCKELASQVPDGKGGFVYKCPSCGTQFTFTQI